MAPLRRYFAALIRTICVIVPVMAGTVACMGIDAIDEEDIEWGFTPPGDGVFIVNEGNFMYGNATLSFYIPSSGRIENEVFYRANSVKLGDVAQSMAIYNNTGYLVVNNSGVVFAIDVNLFTVKGLITNLNSPRYIHFVSDEKAYLTDLYAGYITIFNPLTYEVTGRIETPGHSSTEQMAAYGGKLFVTCWSYDNTVLVIDTATDTVTEEINMPAQPKEIVCDANGKVWVLADGGRSGGLPALVRLDAESHRVEKEFTLAADDWPSGLATDREGQTIYFINGGVWKMDPAAEELPESPFIPDRGTRFYSLGIHPDGDGIYVGDALDYVQRGIIYRFTNSGQPVDTMRVGITPAAFCFK